MNRQFISKFENPMPTDFIDRLTDGFWLKKPANSSHITLSNRSPRQANSDAIPSLMNSLIIKEDIGKLQHAILSLGRICSLTGQTSTRTQQTKALRNSNFRIHFNFTNQPHKNALGALPATLKFVLAIQKHSARAENSLIANRATLL